MKAVTVLRKPLAGTVVQNCLTHGAGALNVDGCRIATSEEDAQAMERANTPGSGRMRRGGGIQGSGTFSRSKPTGALDTRQGRWPSNVVLTAPVARSLDAEVGVLTSGRPVGKRSSPVGYGGNIAVGSDLTGYGDSGGASRFFKQVKE